MNIQGQCGATPGDDSAPPIEHMETLLPETLPDGWEELKRHVGPGSALVVYAHKSPARQYTSVEGSSFVYTHPGATLWQYPLEREVPDLDRGAYDCIATLWIQYTKDEDLPLLNPETAEAAKDAAMDEAHKTLREFADSPEVAAALASGEITQEEIDELVSSMGHILETATQLRKTAVQDTFLGRRADFHSLGDGVKHVTRVVIGRYVITGTLLSMYDMLPIGTTPMHSLRCLETRIAHQEWDASTSGWPESGLTGIQRSRVPTSARFVGLRPDGAIVTYRPGEPVPLCECEKCTFHTAEECSSREKEGFVHKEQAHLILEGIFERIEAAQS